MEDIELVIKIPKGQYEFIREGMSIDKVMEYPAIINAICERIANGKPLPKGHGRLIDADVLVDGMEDDYEFCEAVNATPTIIEADKESENNADSN